MEHAGLVLVTASYVLFVGAMLVSITHIRYVIDERSVWVIWFGFAVRRVALSDIKDVHTEFRFWNEHWGNTLIQISSRRVTIDRKSGLVRHFVITPKNRDAFIAELRERLAAVRR